MDQVSIRLRKRLISPRRGACFRTMLSSASQTCYAIPRPGQRLRHTIEAEQTQTLTFPGTQASTIQKKVIIQLQSSDSEL